MLQSNEQKRKQGMRENGRSMNASDR